MIVILTRSCDVLKVVAEWLCWEAISEANEIGKHEKEGLRSIETGHKKIHREIRTHYVYRCLTVLSDMFYLLKMQTVNKEVSQIIK